MPPNFDRIAPFYRWLEYLTFGWALHRCRNSFLSAVTSCRRALVLGDGDGRFMARLLASNPHLQVDAIDLSPAMLVRLSRRAHGEDPTAASRLRTNVADARTFLPTGSYDLVVTHFFLDCLTQPEVESLATRIRPYLAPNALWLLSEFRIPKGSLRLPARALIRSLYFGFRILTGLRTSQLPDHAAALSAIGLCRSSQRLFFAGLLTAELWQLKPDSPPGV
jgi:SAM-dependent methyltransferase